MEINVERLTDAGESYLRHMELDDMAALKICLLSTGALLGLGVKGKFARRLTGLTCAFLAAGLAVPLVSKFLDELEPGAPMAEVKVEKGEADSAETLFEFKVERDGGEEPPAQPQAPHGPEQA